MLRTCFAVFAGLALVTFVSQVGAEEKNATAHEGKVVKAGDGKLTMTGKDDQKEHTHVIKPGTKISCDGKACNLEDLKAGFMVKVWVKDDADKSVSKIEAKKQ
ncbi:MAG: hypothetical protein ACJ8F7_22375 [Gemmataceae bacterium]